MVRRIAPALGVLVLLSVGASCNCGRPIVMMTESSLSIPSDTLDFGVVVEGTSKGSAFRIDNNGRASVNVTVTLEQGTSADFVLGTVPAAVDALGFIDVPVVFTPTGPGADEGAALISTGAEDEIPLRVALKGGPIEPRLSFQPNPLAFSGTQPVENRPVSIRSVGTSALNVRSIGIDPNFNPYFAVVPPTLPAKVMPGDFIAVVVQYTRNARTDTGFMEVLSDDADAGRRVLELFPDPPTACTDRVDNDGDTLVDFPNDPGCQDAADEDETNAVQCVAGIMQPCDIGSCAFAGTRTCNPGGVWGACMGTCDAGVPDAGFDAGTPDAGSGCNPNGTYTLDAGRITYACCDVYGAGVLNAVEIDIDQFAIEAAAARVRPTPTQPSQTLNDDVERAVCPSGTFTYERFIAGSGSGVDCDETYRLTGTFVGPNTFVGTFSASFSGPACASTTLCGALPCTNQSWNISAGR